MNKPTTEEIVTEIIYTQLGVNPSQITRTAKFDEDLGMDSLEAIELIMEAEDEFGIEITDEDAEKVTTVGEAIDLIDRLKTK